MTSEEYHQSALLQYIGTFLQIQEGKKYIDATIGGGGHAREILQRGGIVLGIDRDPEAIEACKELQTQYKKQMTLVLGDFRHIGEIAKEHGFDPSHGILFDLGTSLHQLTSATRGFRFSDDTGLDMRMNTRENIPTAKDLINGLYEKELATLFEKYGEDPMSRIIAREVVRERAHKKIETGKELSELIVREYRKKGVKTHIHPATRVFQALRIAVNDELNALKDALPQTVHLLEPGGRIVVLSFHSLEDRIVKHFLQEEEEKKHIRIITSKPVVPTEQEKMDVVTQRSVKLRVGEKL
ncbi:MAG TPA: 16S rRNA (cytosine(1402)-N(4))-methyltransferase RsmH [Patescibacteria group bacterium]|nr:16S rRNA (cytosine(1402)-N(4))-methyltransferase RsmH [Patescibacteria group bacterium]